MLTQQDLARFDTDGFVVLRHVIDPERIAALRGEWEAFASTTLEARPNLLPKDQPAAVFWRHVPGEKKRIRPLSEFPALRQIVLDSALSEVVRRMCGRGDAGPQPELRLFESIVFDKPARLGTDLRWHQDISYFPFDPNNQCSLWIPLDKVDTDNGTLRYAAGSHKLGAVRSTDLQSGQPFAGDERPAIPTDPAAAGFPVVPIALSPGDVAVHDGKTWHCSTPNSTDRPRRSLSIRYLVGPTRYAPTQGSAAVFVAQMDVKPGELIGGPIFPLV